ncbi:TRAP transporter small permease subunit [Sinanaerobacter chloroacetimidivorans]|uniref:TRAP transporter small permease n=1 Tax=Sinanaerobacter chloroacetimidivorans TaxID=2818044 RepID=A0A8J8B0C7_9FIRM|nr:TRAP transporter small permease [Sinanaerobacter chloroacetimidivorans]MBR0597458.1 TRAP transporter small permease [Sinanaerobacter chloroacetimidivorans]
MIRKFDRFMNILASVSSYIGAVGILIIMIVICFDVTGRIFFNHPNIGTPEIVQNSLAAIAFLMLPWATYLGQHVRSTMIKNRLPVKLAYSAEIAAYFVGACLFLGVILSAWEPMTFATKIKDFQGEGLRVPIYPVWWVIIYGSVLSCYQCISKIVKAAAAIKNPTFTTEDDGGGIQV